MREKTFDETIDRALIFAAEAHHGQMRKTDPTVPYVYHPFSVGLILMRAGMPREVIVAGILHDTVEDTKTTMQDIERTFGRRVRALVEAVSEDKSLEWEERKEKYFRRVMQAGTGAKAIAAADKLHNVETILAAIRGGRNIWKHFKRDKRTTLGHYRKFAEELRKRWDHPLSRELLSAVRRLEKLS